MKKFAKIVSLILALVLVIGASAMPAFAASCAGCLYSADDPKENYRWTYNADGTVKYAYWRHTCSKGPDIYGVESERSASIKDVEKGLATVAYYMDANGDLYTDMPKYGGKLVAKNGTSAWNEALYGAAKANTWHDNLAQMRHNATAATSSSKSYGFSDVPDNAWYAKSVNTLANSGIIKGVGNNKFNPNGTITWQQMYWLLERLLGVDGKYIPTSTHSSDGTPQLTIEKVVGAVMGWSDDMTPANDTTPVTRAEAVSIIATLYSLRLDNYEIGIEYGYGADGAWNGYWVNNAVAGRAQEAVANGAKEWTVDMIPDGDKLVELALSKRIQGSMKTSYIKYADASIYDSTYSGKEVIDIANILRAYTLGLVNGKDGKGTLDPAGNLTRAEFCQLLYNAGVFGCVYPDVNLYASRLSGSYNLNVSHLQWYMNAYRTDGTPVNG